MLLDTPVIDDEVALDLWSHYVDKVTVSIIAELNKAGIDSILLKGPVIARWLYADGRARPYGDADLLVRPQDWLRAEAVLETLGFERELEALAHPGMESIASEAWVRGSANVDLHCTIWGLEAAPDQFWSVASLQTSQIEIENHPVNTLAPEVQVLLLATHAAKHGDGWAVEDLRRGVCQIDVQLWARSAELAAQLGAIPAFVAGIQMVDGGPELVRELGLPDAPMPEAELRAWRIPLALGFEHLSRTPGVRDKLRIVARELWPTPAFLRWWTPLARRGPLGLAVAYVWRMLWIGRHAVPALLAWRQVHQPTRS